MGNFVDDLTARGFVSQVTDPKLGEKLAEPMTLYAGFDPTADSLHIGGAAADYVAGSVSAAGA